MIRQAIILAGGKAKRLRPLTESKPKSMIEFNGKPFIEYQLDLLISNGIEEVVICLGHLGDQIRRHLVSSGSSIKILYSRDSDDSNRLLGTGGALKKAAPLLEKRFFILYGDSYLPVDYRPLSQDFIDREMAAAMTVYENRDRYDKSNVELSGDKVEAYDKRNRSERMIHIDAGLLIFKKEIVADIPPDRQIDLETVLKRLVSTNRLKAVPVKQRFFEIGSLKGYEEFCRFTEGVSIPK